MDSTTFYKILNQAKRAFTQSDIVKQKYNSQRIESFKPLANGKPSRILLVSYKCYHCGELFKKEDTQCDHTTPVVPVQIPAKHMSWDVMLEERLCVDSIQDLQILCKPCHKVKSVAENAERRDWVKKAKFIVYMTTNQVNGKRYIGVHKCINLDDGYLGSGTAIRSAISKYGKDKFYRKVLYVFNNSREAYEKEAELVTLDKVDDPSFYNLKPGGFGATIGKPPLQSKKVLAINLEHGNTISFSSYAEAGKALGICKSIIGRIASQKDRRRKAKGWTFKNP